MITDSPIPFSEAVKHLASKEVLPTSMTSAQLKSVDAALRRQSLFSAQTMLEGYLEKIKSVIESVLNPTTGEREGQPVNVGLNPATAREQLREALTEIGYEPEAGKTGTIEDLASSKRLNLVVKTNVELAQGAGKFIQSNSDEEVVDLYPAWELVRYEDRKEPRDWETRWRIAAETAGDASAMAGMSEGRMVALKSSDIWQELGDGAGGYDDGLGNPYPPFAFNSGMWTEDVSRDDAEELGLLEPGEKAEAADFDFSSLFESAPSELGAWNRLNPEAFPLQASFDPSQPRDNHGRWSVEGGDAFTPAEHEATQPLRKRLMLDDEVVWKHGGEMRRGQLGFKRGEHFEVQPVKETVFPTKTPVRVLEHSGETVLVHQSNLRMPKQGFRARER